MPRFDVYCLKTPKNLLVVNVQESMFDTLSSRVVIPLLPFALAKNEAMPKLKPTLTINNKKYVLQTPEMAAIGTSSIKDKVATVQADRETIIAAIDFLFSGF